MTEEPWHMRVDREAAEKLTALLALPTPEAEYDLGTEGFFDPWSLFPLYGSYSSDFDECAIAVLEELQSGDKVRRDLGSEMFREMLCSLNLCEYGSSPRVCFATGQFKLLLPEFLAKWRAYSEVQWRAQS